MITSGLPTIHSLSGQHISNDLLTREFRHLAACDAISRAALCVAFVEEVLQHQICNSIARNLDSSGPRGGLRLQAGLPVQDYGQRSSGLTASHCFEHQEPLAVGTDVV